MSLGSPYSAATPPILLFLKIFLRSEYIITIPFNSKAHSLIPLRIFQKISVQEEKFLYNQGWLVVNLKGKEFEKRAVVTTTETLKTLIHGWQFTSILEGMKHEQMRHVLGLYSH